MPIDYWENILKGYSQPRQPAIHPLSTEEQDDLLSSLGGTALHGIGYLGSTLSKTFGGRAIRGGLGMLSGRDVPTSELYSFLPFSDYFGVTDPKNEVHGSYLLGGNKDTPFLSGEGIGGLGLDVITDPLTYLTFGAGALTHLGKGATKVGGLLPRTVAGRLAGFAAGSPEAAELAAATGRTAAEVAGQRLGGHIGFGLPFTGNQLTFDLSKPLSAIGNVYQGIKSAPIVGAPLSWAEDVVGTATRGAKGLLGPSYRGQTNPIMQPIAVEATEQAARLNFKEAAKAADMAEWVQQKIGWQFNRGLDYEHGLSSLINPASGKPYTFREAEMVLGEKLRQAVERTPGDWKTFFSQNPLKAREFDKALYGLEQQVPGIRQFAENVRGWYDDWLRMMNEAGYGDAPLDSYVQYIRRQSSVMHSDPLKAPIGQGVVPTMQGMRHEFRNLLTEEVNELAADKLLRAMAPDAAADVIKTRYLGWTPAKQAEYATLTQKASAAMSRAELDELFTLNGMIYSGQQMSPQQLARYTALDSKLGNSMLSAETARLKELSGVIEKSKRMAGWQRQLDYKAIDELGGFFKNHPQADTENYIGKIAERYATAKGAYKALAEFGQQATPGFGYHLPDALQKLGLTAPTAQMHLADAIATAKNIPAQQALGAMHGMTVTPEQLNMLMRFVKPGTAPEAARGLLGLYDSALNLWKAGQTTWPMTMIRNIGSDVAARFFHGGSPLVGSVQALRQGKAIPGLAQKLGMQGVTDEQATMQLLREMYQAGLAQSRKFQTVDVAGITPGTEVLQKVMTPIGTNRPSVGNILKESLLPEKYGGKASYWPLDIRGVGGRAESTFAPVAASQHLSSEAEYLNRAATFLDRRLKGYDPLAAAEQVIKAHHNFGNLTPFEQKWMKRAMPFYGWQRMNLPAMLTELAQNPGGRLGQTMRVMTTAAGPNAGLVPEAVSPAGTPIPLGRRDDGKQRYLGSTGMPYEDISALFSMRQLAGSLSPMARLPIELATGVQTFSGREAPSNYPLPGTTAGNQILMNSPISRLISVIRTGSDRSRWPVENLVQLAGPHITALDADAARRRAIIEYAEQVFRNMPESKHFERMYVPPEAIPLLSERDRQLLRLYQTQQQARSASQRQPGSPAQSR